MLRVPPAGRSYSPRAHSWAAKSRHLPFIPFLPIGQKIPMLRQSVFRIRWARDCVILWSLQGRGHAVGRKPAYADG